MSTSDRLAAVMSPVFLRLALAVTFFWAGSTKIFFDMPVQGDRAAALAGMGLTLPAVKPAAAPATPATPSAPAPTQPLAPPDAQPGKAPGKGAPKAGLDAAPTGSTVARAGSPALPALAQVVPAAQTQPSNNGGEAGAGPVQVRRLYGLALLLQGAASTTNKDGKAVMPLWPAKLAQGGWPLYFAWAAALTELLGAVFVLVGLFTRFWAFALGCTMLTAMWLTEIGPAVQSGAAVLGFLPGYAVTSVDQWRTPLWQFGLLMMSLALVFGGAGGASLDRNFLGSSGGGGPKG
jgi:uncharacterized membrane protein YphA (DoxX/SURF4 family)